MYMCCESDQLGYPAYHFIGGLSPLELGSSPNKVFLKATDFVFILRTDCWEQW